MEVPALFKGMATYIPWLYELAPKVRRRKPDGTSSARYCYSVWLRHLVMAFQNGLKGPLERIVELGPGHSLGTGLASLISGADKYYALDVAGSFERQRNLEIFDELVCLFVKREGIPDETEFPKIKPSLKSYEFPSHILPDELLDEALKTSRIGSIRNSLAHLTTGIEEGREISYFVPWHDARFLIEEGSIDMVFSQAVLEYVEDLPETYQILHRWLRPSGLMSHRIDFSSHGMAREWNGHWAYSDLVWRLVAGARPYMLNREPHSTHTSLLQELGLELVCDIKTREASRIESNQLASRFKYLSYEDLTTNGAFIQAVRRN